MNKMYRTHMGESDRYITYSDRYITSYISNMYHCIGQMGL